MKYLLFNIFIFLFGFFPAQTLMESYFSDTAIGDIDRIMDYIEVEDGIILSAVQYSSTQDPCIIKLNTNGEVVWSTKNTTQINLTACSVFNINLLNDHYIYGVSTDYLSYTNRQSHIWKVDVFTGEVKWIKLFHTTKNYIKDIVEYDSTTFLMAYPDDNGKASIAIVEKVNGDTVLTKNFESETSWLNLAVDNNKNIYYAIKDSVRKFNLNDFEQVIWAKKYKNGTFSLDAIHEIYMDGFDDLYLFGRDGGLFGHGSGVGTKVNISTGEEIWNQGIGDGDVRISDFKDINGKLYFSHKQTLVGGSTFFFRASKIDKLSGNIDWKVYYQVTPLGSAASHSGNSQGVLGIDVDCVGDVFLTGYYGDANYGPEAWGVMKLNGADGLKLYDLTITNDSTTYDNYSTGIGICVFGNSPVILGHQDDGNNNYYPLYVTIDPINGNVIQRKRIGSGYQQYSRTIDISNYANKTYILKQQGKDVVVEQYDINFTLEWQRTISSGGILFADQISINQSNIYVSAHRQNFSTQPPYFQSETASIQLYKLNRSNGLVTDNDSIVFNQTTVRSFELESDDNEAFIFFVDNNTLKYTKWSFSTLSTAQILENTGPDFSPSENTNIINNLSTDSLLAIGQNQVYSISKASLSKAVLFTFFSRTTYDHLLSGDTLILAGNDSNNNTLISAMNSSSGTPYWEINSTLAGEFRQIKSDNNGYLYVSGIINNNIVSSKLEQLNGNLLWTNYLDTTIYNNTIPYDLLLNKNNYYIAICGAINHSNTNSDALIYLVNLQGIQFDSIIRIDEMGSYSLGVCLEQLNDNSLLIGGSLNRITYSKQGFIYNTDVDACTTIANTIVRNTDSLVAIPEMNQYQWLDCNTGNSPIPGAISQTFSIPANGSYAVQTTVGSCVSVSPCETVNNLGVFSNSLSDLLIYPNPTENILKIKGISGKYQYTITDVAGEIIKQQAEINSTISVQHLSKGVYFIEIRQNSKAYLAKIIKL